MKMNENIDSLTALENASAILEKLKSAKSLNCFLLNIDNFSNINNAYGFDIGNIVLEKVSAFLLMVKPKSANLYHFCSDKFVLIDERDLTQEEVKRVAESIISFFSYTEISIDDDIEFRLSFSIGISRGRGLVNITQAELAIRELRESKRNDFKIFDPSSSFVHKEQQNIYWIHKIKEAISEEGIVAYFQPIVNNHTKKIEKYECLARLKDEDEIISPYLFMESAKVTGNLSYVTKSLISQSFKKFSTNEYEFSINITGEDLALDYLEPLLLKNVNKYNINPSRVVLEMLEDITTLDKGTTLRQLSSLRENGFKIAIDDFGAENSNLSRLLEIQPDYVKIDGAFIKNIIDDEKSQIIVEAIVMICKRSKIKIIAEFVHNEAVQERVSALGIDYSQGYYFGAPSFVLKDQ
jgi:diguanylate cyclase (GGDEF)-like protein